MNRSYFSIHLTIDDPVCEVIDFLKKHQVQYEFEVTSDSSCNLKFPLFDVLSNIKLYRYYLLHMDNISYINMNGYEYCLRKKDIENYFFRIGTKSCIYSFCMRELEGISATICCTPNAIYIDPYKYLYGSNFPVISDVSKLINFSRENNISIFQWGLVL